MIPIAGFLYVIIIVAVSVLSTRLIERFFNVNTNLNTEKSERIKKYIRFFTIPAAIALIIISTFFDSLPTWAFLTCLVIVSYLGDALLEWKYNRESRKHISLLFQGSFFLVAIALGVWFFTLTY